jgi:integrase
MGSWLEHWLATVVDGRVGSDNTRSNYAQIVRVHIAPALGELKLNELSAERVDEFLAAKARAGLAKTHVSRMRSILADALRHAERRGLVARNAAALAVMPRTKPPTERRSFTADEARALLVAAKGERLEALLVVGLSAGLRPGELTGLLWSDIELDRTPPTLTVSGAMKRGPDGRVSRGAVKRSKDGRRTIALPPAAVSALRAHRKRQSEERLAGFALARRGPGLPVCGRDTAGPLRCPSDVRASGQEGRHHRCSVPVFATPQRRLAPPGQWRQHRGGGRPAGGRPPHALPPLSTQGPAYRRSGDSHGSRPVGHCDRSVTDLTKGVPARDIISYRARSAHAGCFRALRKRPLREETPVQSGWA